LAMIQSELKVLTTEERVVEIAQMLSGTVIWFGSNHAKLLN
jgi:DNA repair ATPase RecN